MRRFLSINRLKLTFIYKIFFLSSVILFSALYFLPLANKPTLPYLIIYHLLLSAGLAILLLAIVLANGYFSYRKQECLFNKSPLKDFFDKNNFQTELINEKNKWRLTQVIISGELESYPIVILKKPGKPRSVVTIIGVNCEENSSSRRSGLETILKENNIILIKGNALMEIKTSPNFEDIIKAELKILKENGLFPSTKARPVY